MKIENTPKIALMFLVTTHVKHEELWGQWLHLAAGLKLGKGYPMPAPMADSDLLKRYGPEHVAIKDEDDVKPAASARRQLIKQRFKSTKSRTAR